MPHTVAQRKIASRAEALSLERSGSDPVEESLGPLVSDPRFKAIAERLARAKAALEALAPAQTAAAAEWDGAVAAVEEALLAADMKGFQAEAAGRRVVVTMVSRTSFKVIDREKCSQYFMKHEPALLTVNHQTLQAWLGREAPPKIQSNPSLIGVQPEQFTRPQVRITNL